VLVMVAMSGGVDSSVAAALLRDEGHEVVGVTMKLWGGPQDSGCCSVSDVDDARRVAQQLGVDHHVFNFGDRFAADVVEPYVAAHAAGATPNPCVACNRHVKFAALLDRAARLGVDAVATGHHVRRVATPSGWRLGRSVDRAKDQSYVLYMLGPAQLERCRFPIGTLTKREVRDRAAALGLRTAAKAESQEVCFIRSDAGRRGFLKERLTLHPGRVVDVAGSVVGTTEAVELVTVGQRKGLGLGGGRERRYAVAVDVEDATVTVGGPADLLTTSLGLTDHRWAGAPLVGPVLAQVSAHAPAAPARLDDTGRLWWDEPHRRVAPGQAVAFYEGDLVVGGATAV
jgi:tRNA-specific 2-thiouridylase